VITATAGKATPRRGPCFGLVWSLVAAALAAWSDQAAAGPVPTRPNLVIVFIDDMGWSDLSCFGNRDARTPEMDRLAAEGIRFTRFYVNAPICSPSRVALTTGQYPHRWRITSYLAHRGENTRRGMAQWLDPAAPTLPRMLQEAGYATGHFGKWHMGGQRDVADAPPITAYGFDRSLTNFEGMGPKLLPLTLRPGEDSPGRIWADAERLGGPATWMQRSQITGGFVEAAVEFMTESAAKGRPFYVNLWPDDVHSPFWPPVDRWRNDRRSQYLAVLEAMDRQLAVLFDQIRGTPALRDNTLVLLCSDNGPEAGAGSAAPLRGGKATLYEGGIRSPLIAWGPGIVAGRAAGTTDEVSIFAAFDLVPSLLAIAGVAAPANSDLDGTDVSPALRGERPTSHAGPLCWRRPPEHKTWRPAGTEPLPDLAVREGRWKLLCDYDGEAAELYDVTADPGETRDLATVEPAEARRLAAVAVAWHRSMPTDAGPALGQAAAQSRPGPAAAEAPAVAQPPPAGQTGPVRRVIAADDSSKTLAAIGPDGRVEWKLPCRQIHDLHLLPDGHLLYQDGWTRLVELDADRQPVWEYDAKGNGNADRPVEVHSFQRLPDGTTMIVESGPARIIEVDRAGMVVREIPLTIAAPSTHSDTRNARKTPAGTYLVAHEKDGVVREYDAAGKIVWEFDVPLFDKPRKGGHGPEAFGNQVYSAVRLENGNTLVGTGNGHSVLEVTPAKEIVWRLDQHDLPGITLAWVTQVARLPSGNTRFVNCHAGPANPQIIEVTPDKRVAWTFKDFTTFGNSLPVAVVLDP
jgi:arylsulfatase A-like enzyme